MVFTLLKAQTADEVGQKVWKIFFFLLDFRERCTTKRNVSGVSRVVVMRRIFFDQERGARMGMALD